MGFLDDVPRWAILMGGAILGVVIFWLVWRSRRRNDHKRSSSEGSDSGGKIPPGGDAENPPLASPSQGGKPTLILFHWDKCPHCQTFAPVWKKLRTNLEGKCNFEEYELNANRDVCDKYGVRAFPAIFIRSSDGSEKKYEGVRSEEHLTQLVQSTP